MSFSVLAALLTAPHGQTDGESHEALTGWVFLGSASLAVLIVAHSPHGLAEIQRLLSSSLIGATATDVWVFGVGAAGTVVALCAWHRQVLLLALDPAMAMAAGMCVTLWTVGLTIWLELVVGLSMRVSGMLYTFGCLVLPALLAKHLCRRGASPLSGRAPRGRQHRGDRVCAGGCNGFTPRTDDGRFVESGPRTRLADPLAAVPHQSGLRVGVQNPGLSRPDRLS